MITSLPAENYQVFPESLGSVISYQTSIIILVIKDNNLGHRSALIPF